MKKPLRNLLPVVQFDGDVVSYAAVREYFHWKDNSTIRMYVSKGLLTRVRIGARPGDCKITVASVVSLREHINRCIEDTEYRAKVHAAKMREKKGLPPLKSDEVLIDAEMVIDHYNEGRAPAAKDTTPDIGTSYTPQPTRRAQRPGFRLVRGI